MIVWSVWSSYHLLQQFLWKCALLLVCSTCSGIDQVNAVDGVKSVQVICPSVHFLSISLSWKPQIWMMLCFIQDYVMASLNPSTIFCVTWYVLIFVGNDVSPGFQYKICIYSGGNKFVIFCFSLLLLQI